MHTLHWYPGMPNGAKQGFPDACSEIPSENPEHFYSLAVESHFYVDEVDW